MVACRYTFHYLSNNDCGVVQLASNVAQIVFLCTLTKWGFVCRVLTVFYSLLSQLQCQSLLVLYGSCFEVKICFNLGFDLAWKDVVEQSITSYDNNVIFLDGYLVVYGQSRIVSLLHARPTKLKREIETVLLLFRHPYQLDLAVSNSKNGISTVSDIGSVN